MRQKCLDQHRSHKPEESISRCSFTVIIYRRAGQQPRLHFAGSIEDYGDEFDSSMCDAAVEDNSILGHCRFPGVLFRCRGSAVETSCKHDGIPFCSETHCCECAQTATAIVVSATEPANDESSTAAQERVFFLSFAERELA